MTDTPVKAIGTLINAMRGLEQLVARSVPHGDHTLLDVSRQLSEATRILTAYATFRQNRD